MGFPVRQGKALLSSPSSDTHRNVEVLRDTTSRSAQRSNRQRFIHNQSELVAVLKVDKFRQVAKGSGVGVKALDNNETTRERLALLFGVGDDFFQDGFEVVHVIVAEVFHSATRVEYTLLDRVVAAIVTRKARVIGVSLATDSNQKIPKLTQ